MKDKSRFVVNRAAKFSSLNGREKWLFLEALLMHLWIGMLLKVVPFRCITRLFASPQSAIGSRQLTDIELIRTAIQRAGMVSPWKNRCLVSSLAGRCMLRRRGISSQLYLGVAKNSYGRTISHSWLKAGDFELVPRGSDFIEMYYF